MGTQSPIISKGGHFPFSLILNEHSLDPLPPGCLSISCAHARAPEFYAESVLPGYEESFLGVKCGSLSALSGNYCPGKKVPMGYACPKDVKGNFFLKTKGESLFGENAPENFTVICSDGKPFTVSLNQTKDDDNSDKSSSSNEASKSSDSQNSNESGERTDEKKGNGTQSGSFLTRIFGGNKNKTTNQGSNLTLNSSLIFAIIIHSIVYFS